MMFQKLTLHKSLSILCVMMALALLGGCMPNVQKFREKGISLYQQEQYDLSLAALDTALSYDELDPASNTYAGLIHYRAGNYEQATYHFKTALQRDPSSEEAKAGLTSACIKRGKPDLALDYLERASEMALTVEDPRWRKNIANRRYMHQTDEKLFLGKVGDRLRIGSTYEKLGDYDNALVYYKKAEEREPDNVNVLLSIISVYEKGGNKAGCREYLIKTYRVDPAAPGLAEKLTKHGVAISEIIGSGAAPAPLVTPVN